MAEELLRKGFSAIFEKFHFAALGKSWAVTVCALQRRKRDGEEYRQNVEKKNMNLEPIVTAYIATKGMRQVGQHSLLLFFWLFFLSLCVSVVLLIHIQLMMLYHQTFFSEKTSQLFSFLCLCSCWFLSWCGSLCRFWLNLSHSFKPCHQLLRIFWSSLTAYLKPLQTVCC